MLQGQHSGILLNFSKLPFAIRPLGSLFYLFLSGGFTQVLLYVKLLALFPPQKKKKKQQKKTHTLKKKHFQFFFETQQYSTISITTFKQIPSVELDVPSYKRWI